MTTVAKKRVQTTKGGKAKVRNAARARNQVAVAATDDYQITHYTLALEDDPLYANDELVDAKGLNEKHRRGFLYGGRGVLMQGSGLASNGQYITIDWGKGGPKGANTTFKYGIGGARGSPEEWKSIAVDPTVIPLGSRVEIEIYKDKGPFQANDTGKKIKGRHIDIFVGGVTVAEANQLGTKRSKVTIL
jgi:3D (Asp-Asp-Asp) domain-containing protein